LAKRGEIEDDRREFVDERRIRKYNQGETRPPTSAKHVH